MNRLLTLLSSILVLAGCADDRGPVPMPTAQVDGRVTFGGRPIQGGFLEFLPVDGTIGNLRSAPIGPDGTFRADRVAVGANALRIVGPRPFDPRLHPLTQAHRIRRQIAASPSTTLEIDLLVEATRVAAENPQ